MSTEKEKDIFQMNSIEPKEWLNIFFKPVQGNTDAYICNCCPVGSRQLKQKRSAGYSNLKNHLFGVHKEEMIPMVEIYLRTGKNGKRNFSDMNTLDNYSRSIGRRLTPKARNIHSWLDWIIFKDLPLLYCDCPLVRKYSSLETISSKTLQKYFLRTGVLVNLKIKAMLPPNFGIIFDGWTSNHTKEHYVAIYATFVSVDNGKVCTPLLACSPMGMIADYTAIAHEDYFQQMLRMYDRQVNDIEFLVGDNCAVNKHLADIINKPLVGCAIHRLNLAAESMYSGDLMNPLISKVDKLVSNLSTRENTIKLRACKESNGLVAVTRKETKWTSTYYMFKRFIKLYPYFNQMDLSSTTMMLIPTEEEIEQIKEVFLQLCDFQSAMNCLQLDHIDIDFVCVRRLFDELIQKYPSTRQYLSSTADIIHSPCFESGLMKIQQGMADDLTSFEKEAVSMFKIEERPSHSSITEPEVKKTFAERVMEKCLEAKRRRASKCSVGYRSAAHVFVTSYKVKRLFSRAKIIQEDRKCSMNPNVLENFLYLKENKDFWDGETVEEAIRSVDTNFMEDGAENDNVDDDEDRDSVEEDEN